MNDSIIHTCRVLVALWDTYDELYSMRIHNESNCQAFDKNIKTTSKILLEKLREIEDQL